MKNKVVALYTWLGILAGFLIILGSSWWAIRLNQETFSIAGFWEVQQTEPLLWVIDSSPLIIGVLAYLLGRTHNKLLWQIADREALIQDKTERYVAKNKELEEEIGQHVQTEKQLILAKEDAERAKRAEELFLANMSHELRTPLNGVVGFTKLLLSTRLDKTQNDYVNTVQEAANHLLAIINDILEISKIKAGEIEFASDPLSPTKLIMSSVNTFKAMADSKQIALYEEIDRKIPPYILGDITRLNQILLNLINNAVKFTHEGFVKVVATRLHEDEKNVGIRFSVHDTGIGIPKEKLEDIFSKFKQADKYTTSQYGGTGLGLAICKNMVEMQGGTISVESAVNKGSVFSFELTFKKAGYIPALEESRGAFEQKDIGQLKILLVEDNKINIKLAENVFKKWGDKLEYDVALNGKEAIKLHEQNQYNLILMDLQMPIMDGFEATAYIRKELPHPLNKTPIIALTADVMTSEKNRAYEAGIDDYITKPFDANKLFTTITRFVQG